MLNLEDVEDLIKVPLTDALTVNEIASIRLALPALLECARALEWYADGENWDYQQLILNGKVVGGYSSNTSFDTGQRARAALAKLRQNDSNDLQRE